MESSVINFVLLIFLALGLFVIGVSILSLIAKVLFPKISFLEAFYDLFLFFKFFALFMCAVFLVMGVGSVVIHSFIMIAAGKPIF